MSDEAARAAIRSQLDTTMLVEAGAGSGKTTLMVDRLVAYAMRGTPMDAIAAVTFTRKAANELRERFESRLEEESYNVGHDPTVRERLQQALRERERMFIGTVHAFCSRILREHALDAGLPLDFTELDRVESKTLRVASWHDFLERATRQGDTRFDALRTLGIDPFVLAGAFQQYEQYRDVTFATPHVPRPAHEKIRDELVALLHRGFALRNAAPGGKRDDLQKTLDRLWNRYQSHDAWSIDADFARDTATLLSSSNRKVVQKHWGSSKEEKAAAKHYGEDVDAFVTDTLATWMGLWWAHAYPAVIALFQAGSHAALSQRRRLGRLGFDDLLTETARLLRHNGHARRALSARWEHLLVDEFQDTDPVQAEICFLLASEVGDGNDWRSVALRPGSLFVVGDPKQSIYRFRRADLATYRMVESRIARFGVVERLTQNFRSVSGIGALVNAHFRDVFVRGDDANASAYQAPFAEFIAASTRQLHVSPAVAHYWVGPDVLAKNPVIVAEDAARLASWIAQRCSDTGDRKPQDFLILTARKDELATYVHELALRNIPVSVSGASSGANDVLVELLVILRALTDPSNAVAVIAALEGWCAGCSHADLYDAHVREIAFRITHAPRETTSPVGSALRQLNSWFVASQRVSPSSLIERIADESGLLLLAASGDLGDRNAGQLLQLAAKLRSDAGSAGDLTSAIAVLEAALDDEDSDPSLRSNRGDTVRVMNLHKAKGLEAAVVILAAPIERKPGDPCIATWRDASDNSVAAMTICDNSNAVVAQPLDWEALKRGETERQDAERERLLYVATTRAQDELVIARRRPFTSGKKLQGDGSAWSPLAPALEAHSIEITLNLASPQGRRSLDISATEMTTRVERAESALRGAGVSRYELVSVTEAAKQHAFDTDSDGSPHPIAERRTPDASLFGGVELDDTIDARLFGSLMHLALEGALRGRSGPALDAYVSALVWQELPTMSDELRRQLEQRVLSSVAYANGTEEWQMLVSGDGPALAELNVASVTTIDGRQVLSEGVIDVAVQTGNEWLVVDWKHNTGSDRQWSRLLPGYELQVASYVEALTERTGTKGRARVVRVQPRAR